MRLFSIVMRMRRLAIGRSSVPLLITALVAAAMLLIPFPGASFSVVATQLLASAGAAISGVSLFSDGLLTLLAASTAATLFYAWRRAPERRTIAVFASLGVVVAYAASEGAKLLFAQPRPCTQWRIADECPTADFSLPSNHATLAFAAVWVIAVAAQRLSLTLLATAAALVVAAGRVLEGVHYVHDVAAGALLGLAAPALLTAAAVAGRRAPGSARHR